MNVFYSILLQVYDECILLYSTPGIGWMYSVLLQVYEECFLLYSTPSIG